MSYDIVNWNSFVENFCGLLTTKQFIEYALKYVLCGSMVKYEGTHWTSTHQ